MDKKTYSRIKRPAEKCLMCGADLVEARKHPSAIKVNEVKNQDDDVERKDYCPACWEQLRRGEDDFQSFWIAKRDAAPERTRISRGERNRLLLARFAAISGGEAPPPDAGETDERLLEAERFFLAHLLMRFRIFRWKTTDHDHALVAFENVQSGEEWLVRQVDLSEETTLKIKQDIESYLRKGEDIDVAL